ncbi:MAG TPA: TetR family transcriptional regulator [Streptosporangiaceae bacterium]|jgi:AcrR family transcriptional regulator
MADNDAPGLRERKKLATRAAISDAALRLAIAHGFDNVLVEDIAAAANVSPRTFNNYFSSKQEAIVSRALDRARRAADVLRERPAGEPLWEALTDAVIAPYEGAAMPDLDRLAGIRLLMDTPALRAELTRVFTGSQRELAAAIAERTGLDAERDLYPALVAGVATAAEGVAMERWLRADPPIAIDRELRDALGQVAAGLPVPAPRRTKGTHRDH